MGKWFSSIVVAMLFSIAMCGRMARAVTVRLGEKDATASVILHVGDRLRMDLPAQPSTGYRWSARKLDASHLEPIGKDLRPDSNRLDTAGTQVFVWKAISPGLADLGLEYRRPNDDRLIPPAKRITISVQIVPGELASLAPDANTPLPGTIASYQGTLPCADCTGISDELTLYGEGKVQSGTIFVDRRRYLGAPGGDRTIAGTGKLAIIHGTYADPAMTVYVLRAPDGSVENLKVDGHRLVPLDAQMLPIATEPGLDTALHRLTDSMEGGASEP